MEEIFRNDARSARLIDLFFFVVSVVSILGFKFVNKSIDVLVFLFVFLFVDLFVHFVSGHGLLVYIIMLLVILIARAVGEHTVILIMLAMSAC